MKNLSNFIVRFYNDQSGATSVEYGVFIAVFSLAVIAGGSGFGVKISTLWNNLSGEVTAT